MMINLDELHELVDFMKENGLAELEYAEKNNAIKLRLAPESVAPTADSYKTEERAELDVNELLEAAKIQTVKAAHKAADFTESMAAHVKSHLSELEEDFEDADFSEEEAAETRVEFFEDDDFGDAEAEASAQLTRQILLNTGRLLKNTAKTSAILGMAGAKHGAERLKHFLHTEETVDEQPDEEETDKE